MFRQLGLLILCGIAIVVYSDDDATDCIYDWESFTAQTEVSQLVIDYSGRTITTLEEGDKTYHYIVGPFTANSEVDDSYSVYTQIQKFEDGKVISILVDVGDVCHWVEEIYPSYLLPVAGQHNDYPPEAYKCPIKEGTTYICEAHSSEELKAPSKLEDGKYLVYVAFWKNVMPVGGFSGNFTVLRD